MLLIDDPATQNDQGNIFDEIFLIFYTMEMILKISGLGFFMNSNSYLRSGWNWLDMTIVITGFLPYLISSDGGNYNISVLRTFRVIRPLKTISTLKNLMIIVMTLFSALPYIFNALLILFFFLLIYAIIGLQLFSGYLKNRCFDKITGIMISQNFDSSYNGILCGYDICPDNSLCGKMLQNPNSNITNFDNFLWSILMMIQVITLENWSYNMDYVSRTCEYSGSLIFFISLAFLGAFVFLNLMASVISNSYHEQARIKIQKNEKFRLYNEDVIEYLKIRGEERLKRNFISMKRLKMRNFEFTYDEFYDMKSNTFIKLLPLEIELENHLADKNIDNLKQNNVISFDDLVDVCHKKRENEEEIKKPDKNYNINKIRNNISSMEELIVLNSIRQSPDKFLSINSSKKDSGDKEDNDKTQKSLIYTSRFNLSKEKNRQNKQSENTILDTNKPDKNALAEENEKNNKHENDKKNGKWLKTLRINRLFTRFQTDNLTKLKEKFKKFKLKVDHSFEYFSCSYADVAQKSIIAKKKLDEDIFQKRMKEGRFDVSYKMRQNFELNKRKIKEKFEHELVKKYRELNEKEGNNTMKKAFFYFTPHQIRLPLLIGTNSYVFQAKIENLLEKIMMKKKRKFHKSLFKNKIHKKIRRKKRLLSIKLVLEDIKFSMSEILNNYISDEEIEKEFSSKSDYKYIRNYDLETRKLNEKIEGIDIELNWSGKEVMNYTNLYNMEKIIQRIKQENKILMALTTKNQDKLIWVNGLAGKVNNEIKNYQFIFKLI